jgi:hypothetical protein
LPQAELQAGRQVALHVTSRDGESSPSFIELLLTLPSRKRIHINVCWLPIPEALADIPRSPESFNGSIQCSTAPSQQVLLLPSLKARVEMLHHDRGESLLYVPASLLDITYASFGTATSVNDKPALIHPFFHLVDSRIASAAVHHLNKQRSTPRP